MSSQVAVFLGEEASTCHDEICYFRIQEAFETHNTTQFAKTLFSFSYPLWGGCDILACTQNTHHPSRYAVISLTAEVRFHFITPLLSAQLQTHNNKTLLLLLFENLNHLWICFASRNMHQKRVCLFGVYTDLKGADMEPTGVEKATSWNGPAVPNFALGIHPRSPPFLYDLHSEYFCANCFNAYKIGQLKG